MPLSSLPNLAQCKALVADTGGTSEFTGGQVGTPSISHHTLVMPPWDCHSFRRDFNKDFGTSHLGGECWGGARKAAFGKSANCTNSQTLWVAALRTEHNAWEKRGLILWGIWMTLATGIHLMQFNIEFTNWDFKGRYCSDKCSVLSGTCD